MEFRGVVTNQRGGAEWFLGETREEGEEEIAFSSSTLPYVPSDAQEKKSEMP